MLYGFSFIIFLFLMAAIIFRNTKFVEKDTDPKPPPSPSISQYPTAARLKPYDVYYDALGAPPQSRERDPYDYPVPARVRSARYWTDPSHSSVRWPVGPDPGAPYTNWRGVNGIW